MSKTGRAIDMGVHGIDSRLLEPRDHWSREKYVQFIKDYQPEADPESMGPKELDTRASDIVEENL